MLQRVVQHAVNAWTGFIQASIEKRFMPEHSSWHVTRNASNTWVASHGQAQSIAPTVTMVSREAAIVTPVARSKSAENHAISRLLPRKPFPRGVMQPTYIPKKTN